MLRFEFPRWDITSNVNGVVAHVEGNALGWALGADVWVMPSWGRDVRDRTYLSTLDDFLGAAGFVPTHVRDLTSDDHALAVVGPPGMATHLARWTGDGTWSTVARGGNVVRHALEWLERPADGQVRRAVYKRQETRRHNSRPSGPHPHAS
jgi:hypothetical protein